MFRMEFNSNGFRDSPSVLEENVNGFGGKALLTEIRNGFEKAGYECDTVDAEDWGWYFFAVRNGAKYLCGGHVTPPDEDTPSSEVDWCSAFVVHERGLFDKLFGRNKRDPEDNSARVLQAMLSNLPGITDLELSEN